MRLEWPPTYLPTYETTDSMEQSHSWEANSYSASQKIPRRLWNPKVMIPCSQEPANSEVLCTIRNKLLVPPSWRPPPVERSRLIKNIRSYYLSEYYKNQQLYVRTMTVPME
jgi:hypothetical protein